METGRVSDIIYARSVENKIIRQRVDLPEASGEIRIRMFSESFCGHFHDAGKRAVIYASNEILAGGFKPVGVALSLMIPERLSEKKMSDIIAQADGACERYFGIYPDEIKVFTDDNLSDPCRVTMTVSVAAVPLTENEVLAPAEGYDVVIAGWIAMDEVSDVAIRHSEKLKERLPASLVDRASAFSDCLSVEPYVKSTLKYAADHSRPVFMQAVSDRGILCDLWRFAEKYDLGLKADGRSIPVLQEIIEICEFFDVDPYRMESAGALLIAAEDGEELAGYLSDAGYNAQVIGKLTGDNDRVVMMDEEYRYLEPYRGGRKKI